MPPPGRGGGIVRLGPDHEHRRANPDGAAARPRLHSVKRACHPPNAITGFASGIQAPDHRGRSGRCGRTCSRLRLNRQAMTAATTTNARAIKARPGSRMSTAEAADRPVLAAQQLLALLGLGVAYRGGQPIGPDRHVGVAEMLGSAGLPARPDRRRQRAQGDDRTDRVDIAELRRPHAAPHHHGRHHQQQPADAGPNPTSPTISLHNRPSLTAARSNAPNSRDRNRYWPHGSRPLPGRWRPNSLSRVVAFEGSRRRHGASR